MAASCPSQHNPSTQMLARLSPEILSLILDQLRALDQPSVFVLRLVCRAFDALATPVAYRAIKLNRSVLDPRADRLFPRLLNNVFRFTSDVTIRSDLNSSDVKRVLAKIKRLSLIRWRFVPRGNGVPRLWLPSDVLDRDQMLQNGTRIAIENLPLGGVQHDLDESCFHPLLTRHLVSLKLSSSNPPLTTRSDSLRRLILQSPRLRTMHYRDLGMGTSFHFAGAERLPPVVDLALQSYNWDHTPDEVGRHWDFSQIQSLELANMPVSSFLQSVSLGDFARLHTLKVEDYGGHLQDTRSMATLRLCDLVRDHILALEVLEMTCHTKLFALEAIGRHGDSLRVLRFRDHVGFEDDDKRCPTLGPADLARLAARLRHVHSLELDMDAAPCEAGGFVDALCSFESLHSLTLHVQTRIRPSDPVDPGTDRDYEAALDVFGRLIRRRAQKPWRRITINVGGWRRAMVRRMGYGWKRHNAQGVFAERCFRLERNERGRYGVHEEAAYESPRCRSPVEL
ncbi:hypothetical protein CDD83_158 [Cordyceps sp. RAO-2017]|nr:hypothetical protein CDD83_158 [Cordyceps sp. RAO-2017]